METKKETLTKEDFYNKIFAASGMKEKRSILKDLSATAKTMLEFNPNIEEIRVNEVILNHMYKGEKHHTFNTFKGWKELGFMVKKGSKAFFIWSTPRKVTKKNENPSPKENDEKQYKMFGIAHLFSNEQVEPLTDKAKA